MGNKSFIEGSRNPSFLQVLFCLRQENNKLGNSNWLKSMKNRCAKLSHKCEWTNFVSEILKEAKNVENNACFFEISEILKEKRQSKNYEKNNLISNIDTLIEEANNLRVLNDELMSAEILESKSLCNLVDFEKIFESDCFLVSLIHSLSRKKKQIYIPLFNSQSTKMEMNSKQSKDDMIKEHVYLLKVYSAILQKIVKDFENKDTTFAKIKNEFGRYFLQKYKDEKIFLLNALFEFRQFIGMMAEGVILFYGLHNLSDPPIFSRNNVILFLSGRFLNKSIYNTFFLNLKSNILPTETKVHYVSQILKKLPITAFCVDKNWILDKGLLDNASCSASTVSRATAHFNIIQSRNQSETFFSIRGSAEYIPQHSFSFTELIVEKNNEKNNDQVFYDFENDSETEQQLETVLEMRKFEEAILIFQTITKYTSPIHKLKIIHKTILRIYLYIDEFYKLNHINKPESVPNIEIIKILIYIIIHSKMDSLPTECTIIENFAACNIFSSISGYYFLIIQIIVNAMNEITTEQIQNFSGEKLAEHIVKNVCETVSIKNEKLEDNVKKIKEKVHQNYDRVK